MRFRIPYCCWWDYNSRHLHTDKVFFSFFFSLCSPAYLHFYRHFVKYAWNSCEETNNNTIWTTTKSLQREKKTTDALKLIIRYWPILFIFFLFVFECEFLGFFLSPNLLAFWMIGVICWVSCRIINNERWQLRFLLSWTPRFYICFSFIECDLRDNIAAGIKSMTSNEECDKTQDNSTSAFNKISAEWMRLCF